MQFIAKSLFGGFEVGTTAGTSVHGKDRRTGETEEMVIFKRFGDSSVHIAELRTMAFIKDQHDMAVENSMSFVAADEPVEF